MKLALVLTDRCNAACTHCSTSCGPRRAGALPRQKVFDLMDEAATLSDGQPLKFALTGGEPFLDFDGLLELVAQGHRRGGDVGCVTNGYWATSDEKARPMLSALKNAGLTTLAVSMSTFHGEFVRPARPVRVLRLSREIGLSCTLKYVRTGSDPATVESITAWARSAGADRIEIFSVMPHLREGATLPEAEYMRDAGIPEGGCPAAIMTVRETGEAFTCCTPGGYVDLLALGSTYEASLEQLEDRFYLGGTQQILRQPGPAYFARAAIARGSGARLRRAYSSVCDLCTHIGNDPELSAIASRVSREFEAEQIDGMLERCVTDDPGSGASPVSSTTGES